MHEIAMHGFAASEAPGDRSIFIRGLSGLDDYEDLKRYVTSVKGDATAVAKTLGVSQDSAKLVVATSNTNISVSPMSVQTPEGAAQLAVVGKKAQAASRLAHEKANRLERDARVSLARSRGAKNPREKARHELDAGLSMREMLAQRANAQRSATVAGSVLAALKFRHAATGTFDPSKKQRLLGQAAAAVDVGQKVAGIRIKVDMPDALTTTGLRQIAEQAGIKAPAAGPSPSMVMQNVANRAFQTAPGVRRFRPSNRPWTRSVGLTQGGNPPQTPRQRLPYGLPDTATDARNGMTMPDYLVTPYELVSSLAGLGEGGGFDLGKLFSGIVDAAKNLVPAHTIVGKLLNGNVGGAAASTVDLVTGQKAPAPAPDLPPAQQQVADAIAQSTGQAKPPGMQNPAGGFFDSLPSWAPYAGLGGAGLIAALLLI
jgi:hypothetical protein